MDNLTKPRALNLKGNLPENWREFKQNFNYFYIAAELDKKSAEVQVAIFLNIVGPEAVELFNTFPLSETDREQYAKVVKAFDNFCSPTRNQVYYSFLFHTRDQSPEEPFDSFLMQLEKLIKACEFRDPERMLRDRIVLGVNDKKVQKEMLEMEVLDSTKAIEMARAADETRQGADIREKIRMMLESQRIN